jgi:SdiA-regulated
MHFLNFREKLVALLLLLVLVNTACKQKKRIIKSPPHYNFSEVLTNKLDLRLKEISGLAWDSERDEFLAHYDEAGKLFILDKETKDIKLPIYEFGAKGDYEDIAIYKGVPYILRSDGMITKILREGNNVRGVEAGKIGISGTNDFETMYADTARKALVIICKNCAMDNKKAVSAFAFYPDSTGFDNNPVFTIDAAEVERLSPHKTSKFQPSAAAIHPKLKKLFIISSAANLLVMADLNGKVESAFELGKKLFPQPEGLTFRNSTGDMYISNEGVNTKATIHRFVYKP